MAKNIETPADLKLGAHEGKKGPQLVDLMRPGPGTPWEDRGHQGVVVAFVKTVFQSFFRPAWLVDSMRRPESTADATIFAMICASFWSIASLIRSYQVWGYYHGHAAYVSDVQFWLMHVILAILVAVVIYGILTVGSKMYYQLVSADMRNKATPELVFNIFCYALGPSVLAPVGALFPRVGMWPVAAYIVLIVMVMGKKRLYIKWTAAIIATILATLVCGGALVVAYFVGGFLINNVLHLNPVEMPSEPE